MAAEAENPDPGRTEGTRAAKMEGNYSMRMHLRPRMRASGFPLSWKVGGSISVKKTKFDTIDFYLLESGGFYLRITGLG